MSATRVSSVSRPSLTNTRTAIAVKSLVSEARRNFVRSVTGRPRSPRTIIVPNYLDELRRETLRRGLGISAIAGQEARHVDATALHVNEPCDYPRLTVRLSTEVANV